MVRVTAATHSSRRVCRADRHLQIGDLERVRSQHHRHVRHHDRGQLELAACPRWLRPARGVAAARHGGDAYPAGRVLAHLQAVRTGDELCWHKMCRAANALIQPLLNLVASTQQQAGSTHPSSSPGRCASAAATLAGPTGRPPAAPRRCSPPRTPPEPGPCPRSCRQWVEFGIQQAGGITCAGEVTTTRSDSEGGCAATGLQPVQGQQV